MYKPIDVLCEFTKDGELKPKKIKFEDPSSQEMIRVKITGSMFLEYVRHSGVKIRRYSCIGEANGRQVPIELQYYVDDCIWKLVSTK